MDILIYKIPKQYLRNIWNLFRPKWRIFAYICMYIPNMAQHQRVPVRIFGILKCWLTTLLKAHWLAACYISIYAFYIQRQQQPSMWRRLTPLVRILIQHNAHKRSWIIHIHSGDLVIVIVKGSNFQDHIIVDTRKVYDRKQWIHSQDETVCIKVFIYMYIYIYMCVCVCVCICSMMRTSNGTISYDHEEMWYWRFL